MMRPKFDASPAAVAELLSGGDQFMSPEKLMGDLTEEQASAVAPGLPYSIAQLVMHMHFWQERELKMSHGDKAPGPEHNEDTFAAPAPGDWEALRADFLTGVVTVAQRAAEMPDAPSNENKDTSIPYDLAETALHNAYHLGQIAFVRRALNLWPPSGGDQHDW